jgi:hypothetical protein
MIHDGLKNCLKTTAKDDGNFDLYENSACEKHFLDTYSLSRGLRKGLRFSKKLEGFKLIFNDASKIKDGYDRRLINKWLTSQNIEDISTIFPIVYEVKLYAFSLGDNCFTMGLSDKIRCWNDRKPVIVKLLKTEQWKRAKKMLIYLQEIIEQVDTFFNIVYFLV